MYATKYRIPFVEATGTSCEIQIQQADYSSSSTQLQPGESPIEVTWGEQGRQDLTTPFLVSTARIQFEGDAEGEAVKEIFDSPDQEWRVRYLENGSLEWQGFLATDLWRSNPDTAADTIELEAVDGLALLEDYEAYTDGGGIATAVSRILRGGIGYTGLHSLPIVTSMDWRPYDTVPDGECPLNHLSFPETAYQELENGDVEGTLDARTQLEGVMERFGLQLFQAGGRWHLRQRDQVEDGSALKRWTMPTADLTFGPASTDDVTADLPYQLRRSEKPQRRVQRLRSLKSAYQYDDLGELLDNGSFEDGLTGWETLNPDNIDTSLYGAETPKYDDVAQLPTASTQGDESLLRILPTGDNSEEQVSVYQTTDAAISDPGPRGAYRFQMDLASPNLPGLQLYVEGDTTYYAEHNTVGLRDKALPAESEGKMFINQLPGSEGQIIIPQGARLPVVDTTDTSPVRHGEIVLTKPARAGDTELIGEITEEVPKSAHVTYWYWTTSESNIGSPSWALPGNTIGEDSLVPQQFDLPTRTPDGTPVLGSPGILVQPLNGFDGIGLDHASVQMVLGDSPIEETSYVAVDDHHGRTLSLSHRIGDGPTAGHPRGLTSGGTPVLGDWKPGPYSGEDPSGKLLEQLLAEQWMRQQRETLDRRTFQFTERGAEIGPQYVYPLGGTPYTVTFLRYAPSHSGNEGTIEITEVKDAGISGLERAYSMDGQSESSGGGTGGTILNTDGRTVEGVSTWSELTGKPTGIFAENGDSDGIAETTSLLSDDVQAALGYSPVDELTSILPGDGLTGGGDLTQDRTLGVDSTVARTDQHETFEDDVTVQGDLTVSGDEIVVHTETTLVSDNLQILEVET